MAEALPSDTCDFPFLCQFAENSLHSTLGYLVFHGNFRHSDFGASTNFIDNRALQTDIQTDIQTDTLRSFANSRWTLDINILYFIYVNCTKVRVLCTTGFF